MIESITPHFAGAKNAQTLDANTGPSCGRLEYSLANHVCCTLNSPAAALLYLVQCLPDLCFCPGGPSTSVLAAEVSPEDRAQVAHYRSRAIGRGEEIAVVMIHLPSRLEANLSPSADASIESNRWVRVRPSLDHKLLPSQR
jgi:hypothetical protein